MGDRGPDPEFTTGDVLAVFTGLDDSHEPLTTSEIADSLECSRPTAYNLLTELSDEGKLKTKKVAASGRVWWKPE